MIKIYFYAPSFLPEHGDGRLYVNTAPIYLHSYLKRHDPDLAGQIEWTKIQLLERTREQLIADIHRLQIDVLCVSLYVWNSFEILDLIRGIKRDLGREVKIIAGGPSVDPHRNKQYLDENPDLDFAVYAQGEEAFWSILDHLIRGNSLNIIDTKNAAWKTDANMKMGQFNFVREKEISPYLEAQELLRQIVADPDYQALEKVLPYETSKGCAYNCSFCDWTSGLTHKVSYRKAAWEQELELLGELGLFCLHLADSNFGQVAQDLEIARAMVRLKQEKGYPWYIFQTNFSKLRKKEAFEILKIFLAAGLVPSPKFAVEDTHDFILKNIERPDVPWPEHRRYIQEIKDLYPNAFCRVELIMGLPGQTRETWEETLLEVGDVALPFAYFWFVLPNSPAGYDADYRDRMQLKTMYLPSLQGQRVRSEVVVGTYSYDFDDYIYFVLLRELAMHRFFGRLKDRRRLFQLVKQAPNLASVLEKIKRSFLTTGVDDTWIIIEDFMIEHIRQHPESWRGENTEYFINCVYGIPNPYIKKPHRVTQ